MGEDSALPVYRMRQRTLLFATWCGTLAEARIG